MCDNNLQRTGRTGTVQIATANPNLNGTGAIGNLLTAASDGTFINSVVIKSQVVNTQGMIRLFLNDGSSNYLIQEVIVPATVPTGVVPSFSATLYLNMDLNSGYSIGVSTQNAEKFNVVAYATDYFNCECPA